jgi:DNA-binding response OmpR family regulator
VQRQRILLVQHDLQTCQIISVTLNDAERQVTPARSGAEALERFSEPETALALLDMQLPDTDGLTLLRALRERLYAGPVIFVSRLTSLESTLAAFRNGADDVLGIPFEPFELRLRVDAVLRRYQLLDPAVAGTVIRVADAELRLDTLTYRSQVTPTALLAPVESRLLECLMRHAGVPLSRTALAACVWGFGFADGERRIDANILRVRRKIEPAPSQPGYLHTVRGVGYVFRPQSSDADVSPRARGDERTNVCDDA